MTQAELLALADQVMLKNNKPAPMVLARAKGCEIWDAAGTRYLDMTAGIAVCGLGHAHPAFVERVGKQLGTLTQTSNLFYNDQQILAAKAIVDHSFADRVFFCNSGAEANEGALKLARRYQAVVNNAPERTTIVSTVGSFHGRTFATVAITGQPKYRENFGPLVEPVVHIPYGDLAAAQKALEGRSACCIIVEPIQAEGGIRTPPPGFLGALRQRCDETGTLLIFDEVQTGVGRTGTMWGFQSEHDPVAPDILSTAKGLGGGVPIGAILAREPVARAFVPGSHASTFGGNPLATAAALAVLAALKDEELFANVVERGAQLDAGLRRLCARFPEQTRGPRGRGLLRGLALSGDGVPVVAACRERGVLLSVAGGTVVRFAPPLLVTAAQIEKGLAVLGEALQALGEARA